MSHELVSGERVRLKAVICELVRNESVVSLSMRPVACRARCTTASSWMALWGLELRVLALHGAGTARIRSAERSAE